MTNQNRANHVFRKVPAVKIFREKDLLLVTETFWTHLFSKNEVLPTVSLQYIKKITIQIIKISTAKRDC